MQGSEVEGCPVLWLPDSPIDVVHALCSVLCRLSYLEDAQTPIPFETIAVLLRLGPEYTQHAVAETPFRLAHAIETILLAKELRLQFLLPAAFWVVCTRIDLLVHTHTSLLRTVDRGAITDGFYPVLTRLLSGQARTKPNQVSGGERRDVGTKYAIRGAARAGARSDEEGATKRERRIRALNSNIGERRTCLLRTRQPSASLWYPRAQDEGSRQLTLDMEQCRGRAKWVKEWDSKISTNAVGIAAQKWRRTGGVRPDGDETNETQRIAKVIVKEQLIDISSVYASNVAATRKVESQLGESTSKVIRLDLTRLPAQGVTRSRLKST
ncbi:hypothetical protein B0H14DRAFT_2615007 [Mycena olivaceomarginata]|nr:hypothetical protein B0H14DRAFT_2615007 [Mycena olivaceomarginata]